MSTKRVHCDVCQRVTLVDALAGHEGLRSAGWVFDGGTRCPTCAELGGSRAMASIPPPPAAASSSAAGATDTDPAARATAPEAAVKAPPALPDAAVRARFAAAGIDLILIAIPTLVIWRLMGVGPSAAGSELTTSAVALVITFAYFTISELRGGQTVGKRRCGVRVVRADGRPLDAKAVVVRNLLRTFDALPALYASGLVSLVLSGPERRQRIGDRAAGTLVVASGDKALVRPLPRLLPVATIVTLVLSAGVLVGLSVPQHGGSGNPASGAQFSPPRSTGPAPTSPRSPSGARLPVPN